MHRGVLRRVRLLSALFLFWWACLPPELALDEGGGGTGAAPTSGGGGTQPCARAAELCDGVDNDCDGETDEADACRAGCVGETFESKRYMFCLVAQPWSEAETSCAGDGLELVRIDDHAETLWIAERAKEIAEVADGDFWSGANDMGAEGDWEWTDGSGFWTGLANGRAVGDAYANWGAYDPNDAGSNEDCAAIALAARPTIGIAPGSWLDLDCASSLRYICREHSPPR